MKGSSSKKKMAQFNVLRVRVKPEWNKGRQGGRSQSAKRTEQLPPHPIKRIEIQTIASTSRIAETVTVNQVCRAGSSTSNRPTTLEPILILSAFDF